MSSGVSVNKECVSYFTDLKMNSAYKWVVYKLTDKLDEIVVDCTGSPDQTYDDLTEVFKAAEAKRECRYAVFDAEFQVKDGNRKKVCFIAWSPDTAAVKQKMVYASSKDALKKMLVGVNKEIQQNDQSDMLWSTVLEALMRNEK